MPSHTLPPESIDRASEELTDFSASRLNVASRCGLAFEYQYIRKLPAPYDRGATMFGNAVHDGVQVWYGDDGDMSFQETDLAPIVLAQWERLLPSGIWKRVLELRDMDEECKAVAAAVLFKRPQLKAPTQTKEYVEAEAVKAFIEKRNEMVELCDALEEVKWPKDEDPYKAYVKSAEVAARMQHRWQKLPRPLAVERPFRVEIEGFAVRGRIDQIRMDPARGTGEAIMRMLDIKTGRQASSPMEAFLQSFIYVEAIASFEDLPDTNEVVFYWARHDKHPLPCKPYQQGRIDRERHRRLASRILNGRARQIAMGQFEPSYGHWCKLCDFNDLCANEISLWEGDGLVAEMIEA
jgi:hypothetical protein